MLVVIKCLNKLIYKRKGSVLFLVLEVLGLWLYGFIFFWFVVEVKYDKRVCGNEVVYFMIVIVMILIFMIGLYV